MFTEDDIYELIRVASESKGLSLRNIADMYGERINHGDIQRILKYKKFPRDPEKRAALHLAPVVEVEACSECGDAHLSKRCPMKPVQHRDLFAVPRRVLRWMLENREEI